ncbi:T9SS type A sorting domain-containing protein [Flavobacterium sp. SUN052]|uniref:T9SS type A sorting domain-containing protein n=1 Tax=Flavobacterium sp. SUN052 TaxID=3002441 RepID=UPI00237D4F42|nr:T9SS type A sorting domain-containing protein [Flavobacterium sp. SUN052]MEC4003485.1 T9SS type A sorting domain-containing protein [Flavobacterium sp. SUN052]
MKKTILSLIVLITGIINAQTINIPDANFKAKLLAANTTNNIAIGSNFSSSIIIDTNNNGEIEISEAVQVYQLDVSYSNISSLEGLSVFANLSNLFCNNNQLTTLDLSNNVNLFLIDCSFNLLTTLDTSSIINLGLGVNCDNNLLSSLNLKGIDDTNFAATITDLSFNNNPNLNYICIRAIDTTQPLSLYNFIQNSIQQNGYSNCEVNTYCSFNPGGKYYIINGNTKFDTNNDGCDSNDSLVPNIKFNLSNGTNTGLQIANTSGNYTIPVTGGSTTITPLIENPSYFTVSPTTVLVDFPATASPFNQNFCVTANGVHNDLGIDLFSYISLGPGYDSSYKIKYRNKGTQTQSGTINLNFDDSVLDFVSANPATTSSILNTVTWSFVNLQPFETREITIVLNLNSSLETPPINSGDVLNFTTLIAGLTDETPTDNSAEVNQTVYSSYDPNDKVCLEGSTINSSKIGDYVHYKIRFENTGTANALNIVVNDVIDSSKFDVSTLQLVDSSHPCITKISNENNVEFIYEGINLPFDDATNDGYVVFKIKSKSTLVVGDQITNSAKIYFDYNLPITTNTSISTFQSLKIKDYEFQNYFTLSPIPAIDFLTIKNTKQVNIKNILVYNMLGQLIQTFINPTNKLDVSNLKSGNYILKIVSENMVTNMKFSKQ